MSNVIDQRLVSLDEPIGADKAAVIRALADAVVAAGRATDRDALFADAWAREEKDSTGVPGGIAIPHAKSDAVTEPTLAAARLPEGVDFGSFDGPADLVFLIAVPTASTQDHLAVLSTLARSLIDEDFVASLRAAPDAPAFVALVEGALEPKEQPAAAPAGAAAAGGAAAASVAAPSAASTAPEHAPVLLAVTACPTGIAHTYMAADALAAAAKKAGVELHVETQGSSGSTPLSPEVIARADAVVFAVDVDVRDKSRFAGKPVVQGPVKRGIDHPAEMIDEAVAAISDPSAPRVQGDAGAQTAAAAAANEHFGQKVKRVLLTGVSYMIPFVAGGGLLIALGFLFGGYDITDNATEIVTTNNLFNLPDGGLLVYLGAVFFTIGAISMGFLVPALAGYIAYAIADRPGIAPGFVAGAVAGLMGAGFIGGLVGGILAGWVALMFARLDVPRWLRGLMPVVIIPLVASIVASGLMIVVLGGPIAALSTALNDWLAGLTGAAAVVLGLILGAMMGFDLGGPVNKVAYSFAVAGLGAATVENQAPLMVMAAVMAAGMVPPLAMALATVLDRKLFTPVERENGKAAWLLGAAFISEGAIPFAAADLFRVIPAMILGGAVAGAICMGMGVTSQAPHGGIFVFFAIGNLLWFVLAIVAGAVVGALVVIALKRWAHRRTIREEVAEGEPSIVAA
ncbi:PTS lactose transporter subunit IIC [Agromyces luteolus]|uniref:PTS lactose transporter subunit IIC n=1 Tax=Agromyces luteolus TaxID=88373 RepID=A0A7C9LDM6_9MICO|nr:fructose-specific PTS transporter subunit EIIC [Agromyces luteolus]MUN07692.1 PTS lactose transporter subunit IIC [Agromyces luteolus]GLK27459.1 PTS lactose transporter subunit IIC [Agromyces luteolus]